MSNRTHKMMARRAGYTRIERNVIREFGSYQGNAIKLLQAERARAVRIVKRLQQEAEKAGRLTEYNVLADVLAALTKGRA